MHQQPRLPKPNINLYCFVKVVHHLLEGREEVFHPCPHLRRADVDHAIVVVEADNGGAKLQAAAGGFEGAGLDGCAVGAEEALGPRCWEVFGSG